MKRLLLVLSFVMMMAGFASCGKEEATTEATTSEAVETTTEASSSEEETSEEKTEEKSEEKTEAKKESKNSLYADVKVSNTWPGNDGKQAGQLDVNIYNMTEEKVTGWSVEIPVPDGFEVTDIWSANKDIKSGKLILTAVDYNTTIEAGQSISAGMIFSAKDIPDTKDFKLLVDGKEIEKKEYVVEETEEETEEASKEEKSDDKTETAKEPSSNGDSSFAAHGKLSVKGTDLVDKNGKKFQLRGVSTHGIGWFPDYVNEGAFKSLRDNWGVNLIRVAMYTGEGEGYCTGGDKTKLKGLVDKAVTATEKLGMYCIIDWHILSDNNPKQNQGEAENFFKEITEKYKDKEHILYEICNEPNGGTSWEDVKTYAETIIPIIRKNAKDAVIIIGTPTWSQDVDIAAKNPVKGDNLMYALHFYAATHKENIQNKLKTARDSGLPVFISEFSICDASGNGGIDYDSADKWLEIIKESNLSFAGWSLCNKAETSALLKSDSKATDSFSDSDLSDTGKWLLGNIKKMR